MQRTNIEYLTHTWSPIAMRCTPVSEGCRNCWHLAMARRLAANPAIGEAERAAYSGKFAIETAGFRDPQKMKRPARIGVQFMGDLFHESIPDYMVDDVFAVMALSQRHTFVVLTKRPHRALAYLQNDETGWGWVETDVWRDAQYRVDSDDEDHPFPAYHEATAQLEAAIDAHNDRDSNVLPNVWIGVSVEDQKTADERIPILLQIPAAKHFISYEPALGPVEIEQYLSERECTLCNPSECEAHGDSECRAVGNEPSAKIDWVIASGESGPKARPAHPDWFRSVRDQCAAAGTAFCFKQWGEWAPWGGRDCDFMHSFNCDQMDRKFQSKALEPYVMYRVGKRAAGHLLDGQEHREMPK